MSLFCQPPVHQSRRPDQDKDQRLENPVQDRQRHRHPEGEPQGEAVGVDLREDLPEKKQQEGDHHHLDHEAKHRAAGKVEQRTGHEGCDDHDADINEIIGDQDVGQKPLGFLEMP
jgi:hypothetical protein